MEKNKLKTRQVSNKSISSSDSSASSSNEYQNFPKPPAQSRADSSKMLARQRALNIKNKSINDNKHLINDDLMDLLSLDETSRPQSSLTKYKALPQIGTKIDLSQYSRSSSVVSNFTQVEQENSNEEILIGLRLPNGTKFQKAFQINAKLSTVLNYALEELKTGNLNDYTLLQMPNLIINDLDKSLKYYNIENRSMLFVIDKNLL